MNGATATRRPHLGGYRRVRVSHVLATLAAVAAMVGALRVLAVPDVVGRISVENPTTYDVTIFATGDDRGGWMPVGVAPAGATTAFQQVIDQGGMWIFRFSYQGQAGAELRVARAQLRAGDWRVQVPSEPEALASSEPSG